MKYMIVDDNPAMLKLIRQEVCSEEDTIVECSDGEDALTAYSKHLPDFVLMDVKMNKVNGITATKMIIDKFPDARIIILTNYNTTIFRITAKKAGAVAFVSKENLFEVKDYLR
ncbi:MAG: response regulator transcription factor [Ignavibacteria bacterium]|jgi:DNA-binding NarL/FixJ family response regulator|nr:response regulator transcription factor [Ignavibacteria bacterium]MDP3829723.1 response regulator transcription factor [Ignavibacteriaceae bacterium]